jgi:hypothetical protein
MKSSATPSQNQELSGSVVSPSVITGNWEELLDLPNTL